MGTPARVRKEAVEFKRVSLNFTVPDNVSSAVWNHMLDAIERFAKKRRITVYDLDLTSTPSGGTERVSIPGR